MVDVSRLRHLPRLQLIRSYIPHQWAMILFIISSKLRTLTCGLHLSYAKHIIILLQQMLVCFLPLTWWISTFIIIENQCKWRLYKESLALWFWETDTKTWWFRSLRYFLLLNPINAALGISWHCVTECTFGQL